MLKIGGCFMLIRSLNKARELFIFLVLAMHDNNSVSSLVSK